MNKEWYSAKELVCLPGLPATVQNINLRAKKEAWQCRDRQGKGGGKEYHITALPEATRQYLLAQAAQAARLAQQAEAREQAQVIAAKLALEVKTHQQVRESHYQKVLTQAAQLRGEAKKRFESRSLVLEMWQNYLKNSNEGKTVATDKFIYMWKHNTFPLAPEFAWVREFLGEKLVKGTLYRWLQDPENLIPKYGNRQGQTLIDTQPDVKNFVLSMLYTHPQVDPKDVRRALETRLGKASLRLPSISAIGRWIKRYKDENQAVYKAINQPDAWKNNHMPAQGKIEVSALNERWEVDATPADWMLEDGRYTLLGKIDVYSRMPRILLSPTATSGAQAKLLRDCFMQDGVPKVLKTDNGADYVSMQIRTALRLLDIEQDVSNPFSPWEKPHIERFFRTLSHSLLEMFPGFIGHNVAERSEIEDRKQFSERLFKKDSVIEVKMSAAQLQEHINHWIEYVYMHEAHEGLDGKTPFEVLAEWTQPIRRIQNERALDILLADVGERTVGKEGIRLNNFTYLAPELGPIVGQKVQVRKDPIDVGTLYVFQGGEFICIAEDSRFVGIRRQEIAIKAKQNALSAIKEQKAEIRKIKSKANTKNIAEEILAHKREQHNVSMLPKRTEDYSNSMLEAAAEAAAMRQPSTETKPVEALKPLEVVAMPSMTNPQDVHRRYLRLINRLEKGEVLNQEESRFYRGYHDTPECRDMQEFFEDFGLLNTVNQ